MLLFTALPLPPEDLSTNFFNLPPPNMVPPRLGMPPPGYRAPSGGLRQPPPMGMSKCFLFRFSVSMFLTVACLHAHNFEISWCDVR